MKAEEFDDKFDSGKEITSYLDMNTIRRPGHQQQRVNIDFPVWVIKALDKEAARIGVTRQSLIKVWIVERLEQHKSV